MEQAECRESAAMGPERYRGDREVSAPGEKRSRRGSPLVHAKPVASITGGRLLLLRPAAEQWDICGAALPMRRT